MHFPTQPAPFFLSPHTSSKPLLLFMLLSQLENTIPIHSVSLTTTPPNDINPFPFLHISVFTLLYIHRKQPNETSTPPPPRCSENNALQPSFLPNTPTHFKSPPLKRDCFIRPDKEIQPKIFITF